MREWLQNLYRKEAGHNRASRRSSPPPTTGATQTWQLDLTYLLPFLKVGFWQLNTKPFGERLPRGLTSLRLWPVEAPAGTTTACGGARSTNSRLSADFLHPVGRALLWRCPATEDLRAEIPPPAHRCEERLFAVLLPCEPPGPTVLDAVGLRGD